MIGPLYCEHLPLKIVIIVVDIISQISDRGKRFESVIRKKAGKIILRS